jgi:hypothetical protein
MVPSRNPCGDRSGDLLNRAAHQRLELQEEAVMAVSANGSAHVQSSALGNRRRDIHPDDPRLPDAFVGALAFTSSLAVSVALATGAKDWHWGAQLAAMAATVALVCWWCRPLPSLLVSLCGWLMLNGVVVNGDAQLGWSGHRDVVRVLVLVTTGLCVSLARALALHFRSHSPVQRQGEPGA